MSLLTSILILIIASRLLGELVVRLGQPRITGEIFAGFILGPSLFNIVHPTESLDAIAELSVFLIVLSAGLEMEFKDVMNAIRGRRAAVALLDFLVPFILGGLAGASLGYDTITSVFIGLCMSITALPVAVRILKTFKILDSTIGRYSIVTAILNDVLALLLLGVLLDTPTSGNAAATSASVMAMFLGLLKTSIKLLIFAFIVFIASRVLVWGGSQTRYFEQMMEKLISFFGREALFGIAVIFVLLFGSTSENLGTHFIIGAFFGALLLSKDVFGSSLFSELEQTIHSITTGFLAPIFFANLGIKFSIQGFSHPITIVTILVVAIFSKIIAGYVGGRLLSISKVEALGVGIILNGRGIMELVVANIAYQRGLIDQDLFTCLVIMGIVTTLLTPLLFKKFVLPKLPKKEYFPNG